MSLKRDKKYDAIFEIESASQTPKRKRVSFGAKGSNDYTLTNDEEAKERYLKRHAPRENWNDPLSAGALSRWILWNKPTLSGSILDFKKRFNL